MPNTDIMFQVKQLLEKPDPNRILIGMTRPIFPSLLFLSFYSYFLSPPLPQQSTNISFPNVDSREPSELARTGRIPRALNIPVTSQPDSFFISAEEFADRFGFDRPGKDQEVVFYCRSGVRSRAAAELARQAGWGNVAEYQGSWLDWEKNGGEKES